MNAGAHGMVRTREIDGRPLHIVDGLFAPDLVRVVFEAMSRQAFTLSDYDNDATAQIRHWKSEFEPAFFAANPLLRHWHERIVG